MKYIKLVVLSALFFWGCKSENSEALANIENDELQIYDFEGLQPLLSMNDDKTYVVNFWATWCAPCIKELPYFEQLNRDYKGKNVEVILVSLDFPRMYDKKLKPYIKDNNLQSRVVALNDPDMNTWIPKVDPDWTGAIPATVIYNKSGRKFYERSFNYDELVTELRTFIEN